MRSSQAAVDLIIAEEVTSKEVYISKYMRPEWPQGASGVTIGIGYDLGYATKERIAQDWGALLPASMVAAMQSVAGVTGTAAKAACARVKSAISVPWEAAVHVFETRDMPKWEAVVLKACPGSENLPAGCFGVITSIAFNRGASFSKAGDRYREMRAIRIYIQNGDFENIPAEITSMKRLWPGDNMRGLRLRRDREAALFTRALAAAPQATEEFVGRVDTGDDKEPVADVTPQGNEQELNVQPVKAQYSVEIELLQTKLVDMHYHEVGDIDGLFGGKFRGAVTAFMNDRGQPSDGITTKGGFVDDAAKKRFVTELNQAIAEGWSRPIAPARANATAKDIATKVQSVNLMWYQKLWAYILGVPSAAIAGFKSLFGDQSSPTGYVSTIKDFFSSIPAEYYALAALGLAVAVLIAASRSQNATVAAYRKGEIN